MLGRRYQGCVSSFDPAATCVQGTDEVEEAKIHVGPDHVMLAWQAIRIGDSVFLKGRDSSFREVNSGFIEFFDPTSQCGIDDNSVVWHFPKEFVNCQDFKDCTPEILNLVSRRKKDGHLAPLSPDDARSLEALVAKR